MSANFFKSDFATFLVLMVFLLLGLPGCEHLRKQDPSAEFSQEERCWHLTSDSTTGEMVVIENPSEHAATFNLDLNGIVFQKMGDIVEEIARLPDEVDGESLARKAWRFMLRHSRHDQSYHPGLKLHHPLVFLNSAGMGTCDDRAAALAAIWRAQGFEARVWSLEGHVVPEVKLEGRWSMFDPDLGVYYLAPHGRVAGTEELQKHPEWLSDPQRSPFAQDSSYASLLLASKYLPLAYSTTEDNEVSFWYDSLPDIGVASFSLPPGGRIKVMLADREDFHAPYTFAPRRGRSDLEIEIPANTESLRQETPLLVEDLSGEGRLDFRGKEYATDDLQAAVANNEVFLDELEIIQAAENMTLRVRLNPFLAQIQPGNKLCLTGKNVGRLEARMQRLPHEKRAARNALRAADRRFSEDLQKYYQLTDSLKPVLGPEDIDSNLEVLLRERPEDIDWVKEALLGMANRDERGEIQRWLKEPDAFLFLFCRVINN